MFGTRWDGSLLRIKKTLKHPKRDEEKREIFKSIIIHYEKENRPIIYVDESGFVVDSPRTHGYSNKGSRCFGVHDWQAKGRLNCIGALLGKKLISYELFQHNIDTNTFKKWVDDRLLPELPAHSVIVLDNATFHKRKDIEKSISSIGHLLIFQPAYSPDLNKIEKKWSQLKAKRKKENIDVNSLFNKYGNIWSF